MAAAGRIVRRTCLRTNQIRIRGAGHPELTSTKGDDFPAAVSRCQHAVVTAAEHSTIGWIREVVLNCPEPTELARFWARLLGGEPVEWYPGWVTLEPPPHGQRLSFQASADRAGESSEPGGPGLVHFDILVDDLEAAHQRVVAAGGVYESEHLSARPGANGEPVPWRVYHDPVGHLFCLVVR
jgi:catechol 2,3-dioxygenase-like lactoylglutathione lyase family enzyme